MGTKTDAPKLTPAERLARKRAAARLRQQRCRARKRQAMLEKKRNEVARQRSKLTHDAAPRPPVMMRPPRTLFQAYKSVHSAEAVAAPWVNLRGKLPTRPHMMKSTSEPIYTCVSFDSQKSLEESRQKIARDTASPPRSPAQKSPTVVSPTTQMPSPTSPAAVVRTISEEKTSGPLVQEEEAAVMAMLSLKSGPATPPSVKYEKSEEETKEQSESPSQSPPKEVVITHKPTTTTGPGDVNTEKTQQVLSKHIIRPQAPGRMVPRLYDYEAFAYGHALKAPPHIRRAPVPPGYYRLPLPPPHPHYARYHYPPPAPRFVAYEYE